MVKYYGRAKERTGSVNTNQIGLNMSGCVSRVGRTGPLANNVSMRSKCNVKFCGDVIYQGKVWATNDGACVEKAPRTQSFNSGVGHRAFPAYKCGNTCTVDEFRKCTIQHKLDYLREYFKKIHQFKDYHLCLVGVNETIAKDLSGKDFSVAECSGVKIDDTFIPIDASKFSSTTKDYINIVNNAAHRLGPLQVGSSKEYHVLALCRDVDAPCLKYYSYGKHVKLDGCAIIFAYANFPENFPEECIKDVGRNSFQDLEDHCPEVLKVISNIDGNLFTVGGVGPLPQ